MNFGKALIHDILKALKIGLIFSLCVAVLLTVIGFLAGGFQLKSGLECSKNGLLIISSISMFLIAGMFLTKGKQNKDTSVNEGFRKHFYVMGYKSVLATIIIVILIFATCIDYIIFSFNH